jgi:4-hydroxybenzoate polyprenyltransferase
MAATTPTTATDPLAASVPDEGPPTTDEGRTPVRPSSVALGRPVEAGSATGGLRGTLWGLLRTMRPRQWTKNGVVLIGLVFARELGDANQVRRALVAMALFCAFSGAVYLFNDLADVNKDRLHPTKRRRPLPSGQLSPVVAAVAGVTLIVGGLGAAAALSPAFAAVAAGYLLLQAAYVAFLKHVVILDVLALAGGFVLRAVAGAVAVAVPISPWLYVCTMLLALFLALGKRRQELTLLSTAAAGHRPALEQYTLGLLDQLLQVVTTSLLVAYMLYTFFAENLPRNQSMMLTIPFVLYGVFRYLYLVHVRGEGGSPEEVLLRDRPIGACVLLWGASAVLILYLSPRV